MNTVITVATLACLLAVVNAYTYHMGLCPNVEPLNGFEMEKFLGYWHVIEKSSGGSKCDGYSFTHGDGPGKYVTTQDSDRHVFGISSLKYRTHYSGNLTVPDPSTPARLEARFPLNLAGASSYVVFATDYNNYAGVFVCQNFRFTHRRNVAILSRSAELDHATLDNLHQLLATYGASGDKLRFVPQTGCEADEDLIHIDINSNTFSKENLRKILTKAGQKIGQGAEWVKKAGSSIYHKIVGTEQPQHTDSEPSDNFAFTTPQDSEDKFVDQFTE